MNRWWQHGIETSPLLQALCEGNLPITLKMFDNHDYISSAVYLISCTRSFWYVVTPTWLIFPPMPLAKNGQGLVTQTDFELIIEISWKLFCWIWVTMIESGQCFECHEWLNSHGMCEIMNCWNCFLLEWHLHYFYIMFWWVFSDMDPRHHVTWRRNHWQIFLEDDGISVLLNKSMVF